jgi:small-conductance mechanosensitive channel
MVDTTVIFKIMILIVALTVGGFLDLFVVNKLLKRARSKHLENQKIFYSSIRYWVVGWTLLLCIYFSLQILKVNPALMTTLRKILGLLAILSITLIVANVTSKLVDLALARVRGTLPNVSLLTGTIKFIVISIGVLIVLNQMGISIAPILTGLGVGGVAMALAMQETLSSIIAGINIVLAGKVRVGDFIRLETGEEGFVEDISWRSTTVRDLSNAIIVVPNSKLASAIVKNYHLPEKELSLVIPVSVSYESDLEKVEKITIEVAKEVMKDVPGGVPDFEPFIRYNTFSESGIGFNVILRVREVTDQFIVRHEFIKRLYKRYSLEGIEIPYLHRVLWFKGKPDLH